MYWVLSKLWLCLGLVCILLFGRIGRRIIMRFVVGGLIEECCVFLLVILRLVMCRLVSILLLFLVVIIFLLFGIYGFLDCLIFWWDVWFFEGEFLVLCWLRLWICFCWVGSMWWLFLMVWIILLFGRWVVKLWEYVWIVWGWFLMVMRFWFCVICLMCRC